MINKSNCPLVSVAIPNYNYGKYLANCFDSILAQTYTNIEVHFRDNASTDNSMEIVRDYEQKFAKRGIKFYSIQNKRNLGSEKNTNLLMEDVVGKYYYVLASDDAIEPTMIEECVDIFEEYPKVGMVMTSRVEVDDDGSENVIAPFYNCRCIVPADKQAAVFMMSGIAIPGERMVRRLANIGVYKHARPYQVAGDWLQNYLVSCSNDIGYINKPLCRYRVHSGNETNVSERELLGIFEHYKLINHFVEMGKAFNQQEVLDRYTQAVEKLGSMCIRYAIRYLKHKEKNIALKYLTLAPVFDPKIVENDKYIEISNLAACDDEQIAEYFVANNQTTGRVISYDPPSGSIIL